MEDRISWADLVEQEEMEKKKQKKKAKRERKLEKLREATKRDEIFELGREIFVGNLDFEDIFEKRLKTSLLYQLIQERRNQILELFSLFGEVSFIRTHWTKRYLFVLFKERKSAEKCMSILTNYQERRNLIKKIAKNLKEKDKSPLAAPRPNFYLRWPKSEGEGSTRLTA